MDIGSGDPSPKESWANVHLSLHRSIREMEGHGVFCSNASHFVLVCAGSRVRLGSRSRGFERGELVELMGFERERSRCSVGRLVGFGLGFPTGLMG